MKINMHLFSVLCWERHSFNPFLFCEFLSSDTVPIHSLFLTPYFNPRQIWLFSFLDLKVIFTELVAKKSWCGNNLRKITASLSIVL
jgi:hypothetical protein